MFELTLLTIVCMAAYSFEIVFGLAGTIMMLMIMNHFIDPKTLVIYSVLPQILVAVIGLARSPKTVQWRFLAGMLGAAALGSAAGLTIFYHLSAQLFQFLLATAVTVFGAYLVFAPGRLRLGPIGLRALDALAGVSQALFGISGPIAMTRLLSSFDAKTVIRNYALAFFLSLNLLRASGYLVDHTITPEIGEMMLWSAPFLAVTLWFANHLHFKVNDAAFRSVVAWIIFAGGISLYFPSTPA